MLLFSMIQNLVGEWGVRERIAVVVAPLVAREWRGGCTNVCFFISSCIPDSFSSRGPNARSIVTPYKETGRF
jgi:hypothetical protein